MTPQDITLFIYNLTLIPMTFFSILFIIIATVNILFIRDDKKRYPKLDKLPFITVQIPTFNDPIGARCVEHCLAFDYPVNKFEIMIVDDSTSKATQALLKGYAKKHRHVRYVHRENRVGYKPGALRDAMPYTKGELIVVFDADWKPEKGFLKRVVKPFADPKVAIVQTRQGFYNHKENLIARFAAYTLMIYHSMIMPINNKANTVFFCGTAGAIRKSAFDEVGGWNIHSITEDADLTVRLLLRGYQTVYISSTTLSEVPTTFEGFIRQQMRWCYGNTRVFMDNAKDILFHPNLTLKQRLLIMYITLGNVIAPVVVLMTFFGFAGWFLGDPALFNIQDMINLLARFMLTVGFLVIGLLTLYRLKKTQEFKYLVASVFTVGLVLAVANSIAFSKALMNKELSWFCTPKNDNVQLVQE